jgi:exodeoxyribonuclease VII small subunit
MLNSSVKDMNVNMIDPSECTFEQNVQELESLVARLERGELPLAESLQAFTRGMALVQACEAQLARTELEVQNVSGTMNLGAGG